MRMHSHQIPTLFLPTAIANWILIIWQWIQWNEVNKWWNFSLSSAHKRWKFLSTFSDRKSQNLDLKTFNRWPHPNNSSIYIHMYTYMQIKFFWYLSANIRLFVQGWFHLKQQKQNEQFRPENIAWYSRNISKISRIMTVMIVLCANKLWNCFPMNFHQTLES